MDSPYDAPFIMAELDGRSVQVPCGGAWRLFFEIIGMNVDMTEEAIERGGDRILEYEHERALRAIGTRLLELFREEVRIERDSDYRRNIVRQRYQLPVVMMKPEGVQLIIRAALGDGEARDETMRMLVELHRRRYE